MGSGSGKATDPLNLVTKIELVVRRLVRALGALAPAAVIGETIN